jgi:glycosyltransferase involved in cell wall biosynthesis
MLGVVPPSRVNDILDATDIYIMPSTVEGFPLALLEAMARGCVPVASRLPGSSEAIVSDGMEGYLVGPGNASEFADRIVRLCGDIDLRRAMSEAAQRRVREAFSSERMLHAYDLVLEQAGAGCYPAIARSKFTQVDRAIFNLRDYGRVLKMAMESTIQVDQSREIAAR